ncbi:hypothetical protein F5X99DRAFT_418164 [Biscogniauxia marginata]|nr:hypothetical protein F5X99DRAFT_418164 [Biscogniauxia marginata]
MHSRHIIILFSSSCLLLTRTLGQVFVGSNRSETEFPFLIQAPDSLSDDCNSTFSFEVTCDVSLPAIASGGYFPSSDDLISLCNLDCLRSLEALRSTQEQSLTATVDTLLWTYNYTCRRDSNTGGFCAPVFDAWANDDNPTSSCSECVLGTYQLQLSNFLGYDSNLASTFSSLTSSCQATGYPVTSPPPNYINQTGTQTLTTSASPTAAKPCASTYLVQNGDDCHSISQANKVSTNEMLYLNNLQGGCMNFPGPGSTLCMPITCEIYTVQENDTCWVSWNIDINRGCDNLEMLSGTQICVSFPGDVPEVTVTAPASTATLAPIPSDVVDGTNTQCGKYYRVRAGDTCESVTQTPGISLTDFYFLNPEVNSTSCNNLLKDYSYCVQAVGDISTYPGYGGSPTNPCIGGTTTAAPSSYATTYPTLDPWTFPVINTTFVSTTANYTSLPVHTVQPYPVTIQPEPTPTTYQSGMVSGCRKFYYVVRFGLKDNVSEDDTCYDIARRWGIPLDDLYAWNPDLHTDCTGL